MVTSVLYNICTIYLEACSFALLCLPRLLSHCMRSPVILYCIKLFSMTIWLCHAFVYHIILPYIILTFVPFYYMLCWILIIIILPPTTDDRRRETWRTVIWMAKGLFDLRAEMSTRWVVRRKCLVQNIQHTVHVYVCMYVSYVRVGWHWWWYRPIMCLCHVCCSCKHRWQHL